MIASGFRRSPRSLRSLGALAGGLAAAVTLAACGGSSGQAAGTETAQSSSQAPLFSALPESIQKAGAISIGSSVDYPPFEYYAADGKTLQGFEPELATALEKQLGVHLTWNNAGFDTLFTALSAGRYDIVYGAVNDTAEREKTFDFVDYLQSSQGFVTAAGNPKGIKVLDDICGKAVAAVRGGIQAQFLDSQSDACAKSGKGKIDVLTFDGNSGEQLAVKEGHAAALLENYPTAVSFAQGSQGTLEVVPGLQVSKTHFGMVLGKDDSQLRDALAKAWQAIIDDGSYAKVLAKWGLSDVALKSPVVNAAATESSGS